MKAKLFFLKNSPLILSIIASVGVVSTTVMAVKATPKVCKKLEEAKEDKGEDLTKFEIVKTAAPLYLPAVLCGTSTIACIISANALNKRKQMALASAYALMDHSYKEYRDKVIQAVGEEKEAEIRATALDDRSSRRGDLIYKNKNGMSTFYEPYSDTYFKAEYSFVIESIYHFNRNFILRGESEINELFSILGIKEKDELWGLGWNCYAAGEYGYQWIDVFVRRHADEKFYTLEYPFEPHALEED